MPVTLQAACANEGKSSVKFHALNNLKHPACGISVLVCAPVNALNIAANLRCMRPQCKVLFDGLDPSPTRPEVPALMKLEVYGNELAFLLFAEKGITRYQAGYFCNALMDCVISDHKAITNFECNASLTAMVSTRRDDAEKVNLIALLQATEDIVFSCIWRVPEDEPVYVLSGCDVRKIDLMRERILLRDSSY